jgi:hypothetical protein
MMRNSHKQHLDCRVIEKNSWDMGQVSQVIIRRVPPEGHSSDQMPPPKLSQEFTYEE